MRFFGREGETEGGREGGGRVGGGREEGGRVGGGRGEEGGTNKRNVFQCSDLF